MRRGSGIALVILVLSASMATAADSPTILRVSPISVPGAANGRHFSIAVTADLAVASRADAETLCRWMPRVRDTILRNIDFDTLGPRKPGAELPAATGDGIREAVNRAVGTDLVSAVQMYQSQPARRGKPKDGAAAAPPTCRRLGFE